MLLIILALDMSEIAKLIIDSYDFRAHSKIFNSEKIHWIFWTRKAWLFLVSMIGALSLTNYSIINNF